MIADELYTYCHTLADADEKFWFTAIPETEAAKASGETVQSQYGAPDEVGEWVGIRGAHGCGVFATVNQASDKGRKAEHITAPRALFVDSDNGPIDLQKCPIPPAMIIESASGEHAYWLLEEDEPLDKFTPAQLALARKLGTDPSVSDLPRIMRIPGYFHQKGSPFLVKLKTASSNHFHTIDEIVDRFGLDISAKKAGPKTEIGPQKAPKKTTDKATRYGQAALDSECQNLINQPEGGRHQAIYRAGAVVQELVNGGELPQDAKKQVRQAAQVASENGKRRIPEPEIERTLANASEHVGDRARSAPDKEESGDEKTPVYLMVREFLERFDIIRSAGDSIYLYNGRFWEALTDNMAKSMAQQLDQEEHTTRHRRLETIDAALNKVQRKEEIKWQSVGLEEIPYANGVLNVTTGKTRPFRRDDFLDRIIDADYDPSAKCPRFMAALDKWFAGDKDKEDKIAALQEFFGYLLLGHAKYKKALFLYGESNTGKSVVPKIMTHLVGSKYRCTIPINRLGDSGDVAKIKGMSLNMVPEIATGTVVDDAGFKSLVSIEEPVALNQKYVRQETYVSTCKHVFCSNELPNINDKSQATANRFLVILFKHPIPEKERNPELVEMVAKTEKEGLFAWSVKGAKRLVGNDGIFTEIDESKREMSEYVRDQNPVLGFMEEKFDQEENPSYDCRYPTQDFVREFNEYQGGRSNHTIRSISKYLSGMGVKRKRSNGIDYILNLSRKDGPWNPRRWN